MRITDLFAVNSSNFNDFALDTFHRQYDQNEVYHTFVDGVCADVATIEHYSQIPFLPIELFKTQEIKTGNFTTEALFKSSGTTGQERSCHHIKSVEDYLLVAEKNFAQFYGPIQDYKILALLPSYQENPNSSLLTMIDDFISKGQAGSQYLLPGDEAIKCINNSSQSGKTILFSVAYALLDLLDITTFKLKDTIMMETGGMKGRRKEMLKSELHEVLQEGFGIKNIHSEYGMTELLSQAYSNGQGLFCTPPWMKILIRDISDPLTTHEDQKVSGAVNIIDLANQHSCSFIATSDAGKLYKEGFEILGRLDNTDMRGCNLLYEAE